MAICMFVLLITGLFPVFGIEFDWVPIHWISGLFLFLLIIFHILNVLYEKSMLLMWIGPREIFLFFKSIRTYSSQKPGKYSVPQRLMHNSATVLCLISLITGFLMMIKVDTPFWERDPYFFSQTIWGWVYVLHGFSALSFVSIILIHIYFAFRPEKLFYTRSMLLGWITRDELNKHHNSKIWPKDGEGI